MHFILALPENKSTVLGMETNTHTTENKMKTVSIPAAARQSLDSAIVDYLTERYALWQSKLRDFGGGLSEDIARRAFPEPKLSPSDIALELSPVLVRLCQAEDADEHGEHPVQFRPYSERRAYVAGRVYSLHRRGVIRRSLGFNPIIGKDVYCYEPAEW